MAEVNFKQKRINIAQSSSKNRTAKNFASQIDLIFSGKRIRRSDGQYSQQSSQASGSSCDNCCIPGQPGRSGQYLSNITYLLHIITLEKATRKLKGTITLKKYNRDIGAR